MATPRNLTETCTISTVAYSAEGDRTKTTVATNVPCNFSQPSGKIQDFRGEWVSYDGHLHMGITPEVSKGNIVTLGSKDYSVEYVNYVRDNNGIKFMQYLELQEVYAEN